jgi:hypothetical protein
MTRALLPLLTLLLACSSLACDAEPREPDVTVRSVAVDGPITTFEVSLDGETRHVLVLEHEDGERAIAVVADEVVAVVQTAGDGAVHYDPGAFAAGAVQPCDASCDPLDPVSDEVLELAVEDALSELAQANEWRLASSADKKLQDTRDALAQNMG